MVIFKERTRLGYLVAWVSMAARRMPRRATLRDGLRSKQGWWPMWHEVGRG